MFAALNTVEPAIVEREAAVLLEGDKSWHKERLPMLEQRIRDLLRALADRLRDGEWIDGAFSAGDLLMVTVLRRLEESGMVSDYPKLAGCVARGEAWPACKRAFANQLAVFAGHPIVD